MKGILNTITVAHEMMKSHLTKEAYCVDATMGRGYDTAFLCECAREGKVVSFDVQEEALESTKALLKSKGLTATLILDSHTQMAQYIAEESVDGMMFNFGYLPGANHQIATQAKTSVEAVKIGLRLLKRYGVMSLCIYQGGDTGFEEKEALMSFIDRLDSRQYTVLVSKLYNRPHHPPISVFIRKEY